MIRIESDNWRLWCNPDRGVQWMAAEVCRDGHWHSIVPDCRQAVSTGEQDSVARAGQSEASPLPAASFHMIPYSNRIRNGHFIFQGREVQLAEGEKHAIHGAVRKLPWRVLSSDRSSLICAFDSADHPTLNWAWPFEARITHSIDGDLLSSTILLTNRAKSDMPAGVGWHPYLVRQINGSDPTLTLPVDGVFPDSNGDCLPDGAAVALPDALDFRHARKLDPTQRIDACLAGLSGPCVIDWSDGGICLVMTASEVCRYLILYNPDMPHFAVEPVSNANDAFNLSAQGIESGTQVLAPGKSLEATMTLQVIVAPN